MARPLLLHVTASLSDPDTAEVCLTMYSISGSQTLTKLDIDLAWGKDDICKTPPMMLRSFDAQCQALSLPFFHHLQSQMFYQILFELSTAYSDSTECSTNRSTPIMFAFFRLGCSCSRTCMEHCQRTLIVRYHIVALSKASPSSFKSLSCSMFLKFLEDTHTAPQT